MTSKDRFTLLDAYDPTTEFKILTGKQVSLYVFNQACAYRVLKPVSGYPAKGAPTGFEPQAEEQVSPGTIVFPGANGIQLRNVIAGGGSPQGLCSIRVYDQADIIGVGFTPITQTVTAAGAISQLGVIDRQVATVDVASTNVETAIYTFSVAGNTIATNGVLRTRVVGDYLFNNAGGDTLTLRVKFGGTTFFAATSTAALGTNANRQPWWIEVEIVNLGASNSQMISCYCVTLDQSQGAPTTGIGGFSPFRQGTGGGFAPLTGGVGGIGALGTIDTTTAQSLQITAQWSVSSASDSWRRRYAYTENL
jgi:hypothetical protein